MTTHKLNGKTILWVEVGKTLLAFALFCWLAWHRLHCFPVPEALPPPTNLYTLDEAIRIHTEYQVLVDSAFISKGKKRKEIENRLDSIRQKHY